MVIAKSTTPITDQEVASYLGMCMKEVQTLRQESKLDEPEITIAAVIAKKSNHSLANVVKTQIKYSDWEQLSRHYQLEPDEIWEELKNYFPQVIWYPRAFLQQPELLAHVLSIYLKEDQQKLVRIIKEENFASVMAAMIAKISEQKIDQILLMKKQMSWEELEHKLKIEPSQLITEQQRLKKILYQEIER